MIYYITTKESDTYQKIIDVIIPVMDIKGKNDKTFSIILEDPPPSLVDMIKKMPKTIIEKENKFYICD